VQPGRVVDDLVLADLQQLRERRPQPERVDRGRASAGPGQGDDVVAAAVDGGDAGIGQPERVGAAGQGDRVGQLVAQQLLDAVDRVGQQHLVAGDARRDRPAVLVGDLDHDQVLQDVHAGLALAAGRDDQRLGGPVEVQRLHPEGLADAGRPAAPRRPGWRCATGWGSRSRPAGTPAPAPSWPCPAGRSRSRPRTRRRPPRTGRAARWSRRWRTPGSGRGTAGRPGARTGTPPAPPGAAGSVTIRSKLSMSVALGSVGSSWSGTSPVAAPGPSRSR
jgi:hypothetical protein